MSSGTTLLLTTALHRFLVLSLLVLLSVPQEFDSSAELMLLSSPRLAPLLDALRRVLVRWDSLHFLGAASTEDLPTAASTIGRNQPWHGWAYEHTLAFQPGLVWLLRATGSASGSEAWSVTAAILGTSAIATLLSIASPYLLYRLTYSHTGSHRFSIVTAYLSILSPSPSTLVAPTPEPFFSFFSLAGLIALAPSVSVDQSTLSTARLNLRVLIASFFFALASTFRANGIVLVGFVWWALFWEPRSRNGEQRTPAWGLTLRIFSLIARLATAALSTIICWSPFLLNQFWAWRRSCHREKPFAWCSDTVPSMYRHVQSRYWNVGFLSYWEVAQVPNFLLAAPVLILAFTGCLRYYASNPKQVALATLAPSTRQSKLEEVSPLDTIPLSYRHSSTLLPHMHFSLLTTLLLLLASHVQIALRFASPGGMPGVWWAAASIILDCRARPPPPVDAKAMSAKPIAPRRSAERHLTVKAKTLLSYLATQQLLSILLYAGFYPPA